MKYLIFLTAVLTFSCNLEKSKRSYLTGDKVKYWDLIDSAELAKRGYSFSKNGECIYYYQEKNCKRNVVYEGDIENENTWNFKNDSILEFRSWERKIIVLNDDTCLTEYKGLRTLLIKSKCQTTNTE